MFTLISLHQIFTKNSLMKATEQFNKDFRSQKLGYEEEYPDTTNLISSNEVLMQVQLTIVRYGLSSISNNF